MKSSQRVTAILGAVICSLSMACEHRSVESQDGGAVDAGVQVAVERPIELLSWWAPIGRSDPLGTLLATHKQRCPRDLIINAETLFSGKARATLKLQIDSGNPPDVFHSTVGWDHLRWVLTNGLDDRESSIRALEDLVEGAPEWKKVMPSRLLEYITYGGHLYGVPATIHRINSIYYNRRLLAAHDLELPRSVADLKRAGARLAQAGLPLFALGAKEPWPLSHIVLEGLLIAREGPEFYQRYWGGYESPDDPRMLETLREGLTLLHYSNLDFAETDWVRAGQMVQTGQAAALADGDWMTAYFTPEGLKPEDALVESAFPGTEDVFLLTADIFSLTVGAKNLAGAKRLLDTIGSKEGQRALVKEKVCLSPRSDVGDDASGTRPNGKSALLRQGRVVLGIIGLLPPQVYVDVNWGLLEMLQQDDIEPMVHTLKSRYRLLLGRQTIPWATDSPSPH